MGSIIVGDLVRWRPNLPFTYSSEFGIVIEVIDEFLVGVLWSGSEHVYMEAIDNLEAINEKTDEIYKERDTSEK